MQHKTAWLVISLTVFSGLHGAKKIRNQMKKMLEQSMFANPNAHSKTPAQVRGAALELAHAAKDLETRIKQQALLKLGTNELRGELKGDIERCQKFFKNRVTPEARWIETRKIFEQADLIGVHTALPFLNKQQIMILRADVLKQAKDKAQEVMLALLQKAEVRLNEEKDLSSPKGKINPDAFLKQLEHNAGQQKKEKNKSQKKDENPAEPVAANATNHVNQVGAWQITEPAIAAPSSPTAYSAALGAGADPATISNGGFTTVQSKKNKKKNKKKKATLVSASVVGIAAAAAASAGAGAKPGAGVGIDLSLNNFPALPTAQQFQADDNDNAEEDADDSLPETSDEELYKELFADMECRVAEWEVTQSKVSSKDRNACRDRMASHIMAERMLNADDKAVKVCIERLKVKSSDVCVGHRDLLIKDKTMLAIARDYHAFAQQLFEPAAVNNSAAGAGE